MFWHILPSSSVLQIYLLFNETAVNCAGSCACALVHVISSVSFCVGYTHITSTVNQHMQEGRTTTEIQLPAHAGGTNNN
jgi:hypothetical protein